MAADEEELCVFVLQDDPLVNINAKEERTKEGWIKIMAAREARNDLRECYRCSMRGGRTEKRKGGGERVMREIVPHTQCIVCIHLDACSTRGDPYAPQWQPCLCVRAPPALSV